jgi:hypothetical protein
MVTSRYSKSTMARSKLSACSVQVARPSIDVGPNMKW